MLLLLEKLSTATLSSALLTITITDITIIAIIITILATITIINTIGAVTNTSRGDAPSVIEGGVVPILRGGVTQIKHHFVVMLP
jgi:hypothetical protein